VAPKLKKHMVLPMDEFRAAVKGATWLKLDGPLKVRSGKPAGRPKKGYAYVDDEATVGSEGAGGVGAGAEGGSDEEYGGGRFGRGGRHSKGGNGSVNKVKVKFRANSVDESVLSGASVGGAGGSGGGTGRGRGRPKKVHAADEGEECLRCVVMLIIECPLAF